MGISELKLTYLGRKPRSFWRLFWILPGPILWRLDQDLIIKLGVNGEGLRLTVPKGFITDLASVPFLLWMIFPPHGPWAPAAVAHDYLYSRFCKGCSRFLADAIFRDLMHILGVWIPARIPIYYAVRLGGWPSFKLQEGETPLLKILRPVRMKYWKEIRPLLRAEKAQASSIQQAS